MKRHGLCFLLVIALIVSLAGCGGNSGSAADKSANSAAGSAEEGEEKAVTLRMSTGHPEEHVASETVREFVDKVEKDSNGSIKIKIYYSNSLGSQDVIVNGLMDGSVDLSFEYLDASYAPVSDIAALPFIVSNYDELQYLFSPGTNMYSSIKNSFDEVGINLLGIYVPGFSGLATKSIPENYNTCSPKSKPIRVWNSNPAIEAYEAMGYNCVAIDWSDTYTSIQTGIVDGTTGQTATGVYTFVRDVVNYYIPYMYGPDYVHLVISQKTFNHLSQEQQDIIQNAAETTISKVYENLENMENESLKQLEDAGIEVLPLTDDERNEIAEQVRETVWPSQEEVFGKDILNSIYEDLEACKK